MAIDSALSGRNRPHLKLENRSVVLRGILVNGPISRKDIAHAARLTSATISNIVNELIADGMVIELGADKGQPQGGRRPILVDLNPSGPFVIGVHLGRTRAAVGLTDLRGRQFGLWRDLPLHRGVAATLPAVTEAIRQVVSESGRQLGQAVGIGVGVAGGAEVAGPVTGAAAPLSAEPVLIKRVFENELNIPTSVEQNVRAIGLAEAWVDRDTRTGSFVLLYVSNLIGAAILVGGRVYPGFRQAAGQIGHLPVDPTGPLCACGCRGCLEAVASDTALFTQAAEAVRKQPDSLLARLMQGTTDPNEGVYKVVAAAAGGDPTALDLLRKRSRHLGQALAMIGTLLDPERIVIAGPTFAEGAALQLPAIRSVVAAISPLASENPPIVASRLGKESRILGAAAAALRHFFAPA